MRFAPAREPDHLDPRILGELQHGHIGHIPFSIPEIFAVAHTSLTSQQISPEDLGVDGRSIVREVDRVERRRLVGEKARSQEKNRQENPGKYPDRPFHFCHRCHSIFFPFCHKELFFFFVIPERLNRG
jgi:hypothetical protein